MTLCVYNYLAQVLITLVAWFLLISAVSGWIPDFFFSFFLLLVPVQKARGHTWNFSVVLTWFDACLYKLKLRTIRGFMGTILVGHEQENMFLGRLQKIVSVNGNKNISSQFVAEGNKIQYRAEPTKFYIEWVLSKFHYWLCVQGIQCTYTSGLHVPHGNSRNCDRSAWASCVFCW